MLRAFHLLLGAVMVALGLGSTAFAASPMVNQASQRMDAYRTAQCAERPEGKITKLSIVRKEGEIANAGRGYRVRRDTRQKHGCDNHSAIKD